MRVLGVIPARGSSKRLPRKNILPLNGVPLIAYMVRAAGAAAKLDRVIVTTEDDEIADVAKSYGADVPFKRPDHLAEDYAMDADILVHALDWLSENDGEDYDAVVQLQPTTPFILPETIDACVTELENSDANCCFAVRQVSEPPQWMFVKGETGEAVPLLGKNIEGEATHTQLLDKAYFPAGGAYAVRTAALREHMALYVDPKRMVEMDWARAVDIDEDLDLLYAEAVGKRFGFTVIGGA